MRGEKALAWAKEYLISHENMQVVDYQCIVETSYSIVYRLNLPNKVLYLKVTPELLFYEAKVLKFLHEQRCHHIPELIAQNSNLNCFLTYSCGDESIRHLFNGVFDSKKLIIGISNYTAIQRSQEKNVESLLSYKRRDNLWISHMESCFIN